MGIKRPGVRPKPPKIQIWFNYEGERVWETLDWFPNESNLNKAAKFRKKIKTLADEGKLDYAEYFPNSPRVQKIVNTIEKERDLYTVVLEWLDSISALEDTKKDYKRIFNRHWAELLGMHVGDVRLSHIHECIKHHELTKKSAKYYNNELVPLKAAFKYAKMLDYITTNPCENLQNRKNIKDDPDPFDREEIDKITDYFYQTSDWGDYFETAFFTGLRDPSEIIALPIENIDFRQGYIRIDRVVSRGTYKPHTKTRVKRDVFLNPRAEQALRNAKKNHPTGEGPIFRHPLSGNPIMSGEVQNDLWRAALSDLGVRFRPMKNTRHSYATMLLEEGVDLSVASKEMGHSIQVFLSTYAKWINAQKTAKEHEKISRGIQPRDTREKNSDKVIRLKL